MHRFASLARECRDSLEHFIVAATRGPRKRAVDNVQHWLAGAVALQLVRLAGRWHVSPGELLKGLGVGVSELTEPGATLPLEAVIALCERARELTGESGLGFYWGLSQRATGYGYPGFAAMSAESYGQALDAIRYAPMMTTMVTMHLASIRHSLRPISLHGAYPRRGYSLYLSEIERVAKASWAVTRLWLPEAITGWRSRRPMIQGDLRQKPKGQSNRERTECRIEVRGAGRHRFSHRGGAL
jgi:hypothetical protein